MRASAAVTIGMGATAAVIVAALVQGAGDAPLSAALSLAVPSQYKGLIEEAGNMCPEVTPNLLAALITQESGFNPRAKSQVGAEGMAQFMPATWQAHGVDGNNDGKRDVWDPQDAIPSAAGYLCDIAKDVKGVPGSEQNNMLAAYNAGTDAVQKYGGVPPYKETQNYVRTISALAHQPSPGGKSLTPTQAVTAINAAQAMLGTPYSWGGGNANGPSTGICCSPAGHSGTNIVGFDCSGLTLYAYARAGIHLPRTAAEQYTASEPVKPGDQQPGDLVFYGTSPASIHHVGIYIGGGWMLNAPKPGTQVRFDSLNSMTDLFAIARPVPHSRKEI